MGRVVVDANVLIAARLSRDSNHARGATLARAFDRGDIPQAVVISDVLGEVYNYLHARAGHQVAVETLDALIESGGYDIEFTQKVDFDAGRSLARKYDQLSLTDATIVAFMQRTDTEYLYSFDAGFDGVGTITRFESPQNPFAPE